MLAVLSKGKINIECFVFIYNSQKQHILSKAEHLYLCLGEKKCLVGLVGKMLNIDMS